MLNRVRLARRPRRAQIGALEVRFLLAPVRRGFSLARMTRPPTRAAAFRDLNARNLIGKSCAAFASEMLHVQIFVFLVGLDQEEGHRPMTASTKTKMGRVGENGL